MAAARPVIAVASGGPLETVVHEETGFLCEPTPEVRGLAVIVAFAARGAHAWSLGCASMGGCAAAVHAWLGLAARRQSFADAMERLVKDPDLVVRMGDKARTHVQDNFSRAAFGDKLDRLCTGVEQGQVASTGAAADAVTVSPLPRRRCGAALLCLCLLLLLVASLAVAFFGSRAAWGVAVSLLSPPEAVSEQQTE